MRPVFLAAAAVACAVASFAAAVPPRPAGSFTVWAHDVDAANIRVSRVGQAGQEQAHAEHRPDR